jgi:4-diphosphocytidyl-2-C-methyl-D-erythritol kinase
VQIHETAWAKVNLYLRVLGRRPDGYHELITVLQTVSLADEVILSEAPGGIELVTDDAALPSGPANLAWRAAAALAPYAPDRGVRIELFKRIPQQAGLGGGSSDAAAVLRGLNRLWGLGLSRTRLAEIAAQLGSDVPFFLWGGTALATGRGEQVQPLDLAADLSLLIVKPPFGLATAEVYGRYQSGGAAAPPVDNLLHALAGADPRQVGRWLYNDLERPALALRPDLAAARQLLLDLGTYGCLLSGSGSSLFALLPEQGLLSLQQLEQALPPGFQVWQVQMVPACS